MKTRNRALSAQIQNPPHFKTTIKNSLGENIEVSDPQVNRALVLLMNYYAVAGGAACHWGGPAAFMEINSALHALMFKNSSETKPWFENYNFVNDAGHCENGLYALKANYSYGNLSFEDLWKFRSINSPLTGHGEAHLYPEGVLISNGPLGSSLPVAQGLAMADQQAQKKRLTICLISDGAMMEGEVKESLSAISGYARKGKIAPMLVILSNNDTKLSGRISEDSFDLSKEFSQLKSTYWDYREIDNGHDLQEIYWQIEKAINDLKNENPRPIFLNVKTIKGKGISSTEKSKSGAHGYPIKYGDGKLSSFIQELFPQGIPQEIQSMLELALNHKIAKNLNLLSMKNISDKKEKVQVGVSRALIEMAEKGLPIISISSDLQGSTGVATFQQKFPHLSFDVGVAEANMVSVASGFSKNGYYPVVDTFAQFGITKGNLPFIMGQLSNAPITAIFSHTGFQDAADGASHQASTYFAALSSIPNVEVISCSSSEQIYQLMTHHFSSPPSKSVIFFIGREDFPSHYGITHFEWKKATTLKPAISPTETICTFVATGPMVQEALLAHEILLLKGIHTAVIDSAFINSPDVETIHRELQKTQNNNLMTIEDHQIIGGMGSLLIHQLALKKIPYHLVDCLGIQGHFGRSAYSAVELYAKNDMDSYALVQRVLEISKK